MRDDGISILLLIIFVIAITVAYTYDSSGLRVLDKIKQDKVYMKELSERDYPLFARIVDGRSSTSTDADRDYQAWKAKKELHK